MNNSVGARYQTKPTGGTLAPSMAEKIWGWYYKCLVPAFRSRTPDDIRRNGVLVTGIKSLDDGLKDDWVPRLLTIDKMVEFYKQGVPFRIIDTKDTKDIYQVVQTHLTNWLETIRTGLNIGDAPMDDLIAMDRFATSLYPYAKYLITPEALESALANQIASSQRVNISNFFSNRGNTSEFTRINPIDDKPGENTSGIPERESLANRFRQSVESLRKF